jgi:quercetin dioxygenase-like cupin family protein
MSTTRSLGPINGPTRANRTLARPTRLSLGSPILVAALMLCPIFVGATDPAPVSAETVTELMTRDLISAPGKEVRMITVTYLPGGASLPHRHDAQVFVYVLEGEITMQLKGGTPVTLRPGQSFYEGPSDIHQVSANAGRTAPAKILVFMVKDKSKPASRDVTDKAAP